MKFDAKRRLYLDDRGRAISPAKVRNQISEFITQEQRLVIQAASRLLTDAEVEAFFAFMRQKVTGWHSITGVIAYGGEDQMNAERWSRLNRRILSELGYLAEFETQAQQSFSAAEIIGDRVAQKLAIEFPQAQAQVSQRVSRALFTAAPSEANAVARRAAIEVVGVEVPIITGPETGFLIGGTVENRISMYPEAMFGTYENNVKEREGDSGVTTGRRVLEDGENCDDCTAWATEEFRPLDELEEIGSSVCGSRCRCEFEFGDESDSFRTSEIFSGVVGGQDRYGGDVELN